MKKTSPHFTWLLAAVAIFALTSCNHIVPLSEAEQVLLADIGKEISVVEGQIAEATAESAKYESGLVKVLTELRITYLKNSLVMLGQKKYAVEYRVDGKYMLEVKLVPPVQPDEARLTELANDISAQQVELQAAKAEDALYAGGLVKALIGNRIATIQNTIALLDQRRLAERYGIPYLLAGNVGGSPDLSLDSTSPPTVAETVAPAPELAAPCVVSIERFEIDSRAEEYGRNFADFTLHVKNLGEKHVKAWRLGIRVDDAFGTELLRVRLTDGSANLTPDGIGKASFGFEDNQFISDEPYDKLLSYSVENLNAVIASCEVSFSD